MNFIADEAPGICSQEDFNEDWRELISRASFMMKLANEKKYKIPPGSNGFEWVALLMILMFIKPLDLEKLNELGAFDAEES